VPRAAGIGFTLGPRMIPMPVGEVMGFGFKGDADGGGKIDGYGGWW
jgi:hypothetical protein